MGLPRAAIHLLIQEAARTNWQGRIGTLGRQHVYATFDEIKSLASKSSGTFRSIDPILHRDPELRKAGFLSDDSLYEFLGFDQSVRIDRSSYECAEESLDLNSQETPDHLADAFDLILDSGTIEHIFEIGRAMQHCLRMTKLGGRIIHLTPTSNAVNHGFYSVSPALFADYYRINGCEIEKLWLCRMKSNFVRGPWDVYDCLSSDRNWLPLGRLDGALWLTYAVIKKVTILQPQIPQQSFYVDTWHTSAGTTDGKGRDSSQSNEATRDGKAEQLLKATENWRTIHKFAHLGVKSWRNWINARREKAEGKIPYRYMGRF